MSWLEDYLAANSAQKQAQVAGGVAAPAAQGQIDPAFAAAIRRRDPNAEAFAAAGAPQISDQFAQGLAQGDQGVQGFLRDRGGLKINPAVQQLIQGYQDYLAKRRGKGKGPDEFLRALVGGAAPAGPVGEGNLPTGVQINTQAGDDMLGHAYLTAAKDGRQVHVYFDEQGRKHLRPA
jgi:hypothetical protein